MQSVLAEDLYFNQPMDATLPLLYNSETLSGIKDSFQNTFVVNIVKPVLSDHSFRSHGNQYRQVVLQELSALFSCSNKQPPV